MRSWLRAIARGLEVRYPIRTLLWGVLLVTAIVQMQDGKVALATMIFLVSMTVGLELTVLRCRDDVIRKLDSMIYERDEG